MSKIGRNTPAPFSPNQLRSYFGNSKNANRVLWAKLEAHHAFVDSLMQSIPEYHIYLKAISPHYQRIFKGWVITYIIRLFALYQKYPAWFDHNPENILKANFIHIKIRLFRRLYTQVDKIGIPLEVSRKNFSIPYRHLNSMSKRAINELFDLSYFIVHKIK
jgi:hypothetical protein